MSNFDQDLLAMNISSGADYVCPVGDEDEITHALPSPNRFGEGEASSIDPSSLKQENATDGGGIQVEGSCRHFSLDELLIATKGFDDALVIGTGGFGKVYKGFINYGATTVAIKRLNAESKQGAEEFWTEVKLLSKLQHTNLVSLIGYCDEGQEMILVYEYIACGTLASLLYKTSRDVKSTNILLDENWVAKISDFGLSKRIPSHTTTHVTTNVKGTFGYYDPDYFFTKRLTKKSDVYAFGVVLLEVLCGRPPIDTRLEEEKISLVLWAMMCIKKRLHSQIIDPSLKGKISARHSLKSFAELANKCLNFQPKERPTMAKVVESLQIVLVAQDRQGRRSGIKRMWAFCSHGVQGLARRSRDTVIQQKYPRFLLAEIYAATNNFSHGLLINQDSRFRLYKARMVGGTLEVVIKRYMTSIDKVRAEIRVQSLTGHRNIVALIGVCVEMEMDEIDYAHVRVHDQWDAA